MKPIIKWSGGKSKELPIVHQYKPDKFDVYHEPFIGGGAVWLNLNHSKNKFVWESREFVKAASATKGRTQNKGTEILVMNYKK